MPAREVVVRLQLEDGQTLSKFQALRKEQAQLRLDVNATNKAIRDNAKQLVELDVQYRKGIIDSAQLAAKTRLNRENFDQLTKSLSVQEIKLLNVSSQTRELKNQMSGVTEAGLRFRDVLASQTKTALSSLATRYFSVGAAIYGLQRILGSAIDTVVEFNKNLANVSALGGEYRANIDALGEAAKNIGPKFGVGAGKALESVEALAKAGVSASDILGGALEGALTLAASGETDAGTAAEYAAASMVQFGLAGKDVTHIADLLTAAAIKAQGEVSDFGDALKFVGPVAAAMNVSIDEVVGTLATFAQNGILGEMAGTSLRGVLASLTSPSKQAADEMERLGIVTDKGNKLFDQATGKFLGLANLADVLQESTKGLTDEQRSQALGQIFGNRQVTAANILIKEGAKGVEDFTKAVNDQGIASEVATDKLDSLSGKADKLSASWKRFVLSIEDGKGPIAGAIGSIETAFTDLFDAAANIEGGDDSIASKLERLVGLFSASGFATEVAKAKMEEYAKAGREAGASIEALGNATVASFSKTLRTFGSASNDLGFVADQVKAINEEINNAGEDKGALNELRLKFLAQAKEYKDGTLAKAVALANLEQVQKRFAILQKQNAAADEKAADAAKKKADADAAAVITLTTLKAQLKELQDTRETLDITNTKNLATNKSQIDALKKQIAALEGSTDATVKQAKAAKDAIGSIAAYNAQIADLKKSQDQSTSSEQFKVYQAQIDTLTEKVQYLTGELVKMPALKDVQFAATGTDTGAIPEPPEIKILPALLEKARIDELQHIADFNLQRQILNEQYNEGIIKSKEELAAKLADIDKAQQDLAIADQTAALSAAQNLASSIQGVINEAFDNKIANIDEQQQILQDRLQSASDAQTKQEIQGQIDRLAAQKKGLDAQKKTLQTFAVTAALIDTYASANAAYRSQLTIPTPDAPIRAAVAAAAAIVAGLLNVAKIEGFAKGGEVGAPKERGTVEASWGRPIKRSNGDDVLVTLKRKEKVLNADQIAELESITGKGIWGRIGLPGHNYSGVERFLEDQHRPRMIHIAGYATGGTVDYLPSPSSADLGSERNVAELRAINFAPVVLVSDINKQQGRVRVAQSLGTA